MGLTTTPSGGGVTGSGSMTGGGVLATGGFTLTVPGTGTAALREVANSFSVNGAASTPPFSLTGTIFTGGTATTTKPALLIEPTGTTSTGWSTAGTLFGGNAPSGFTGSLIDLQLNGSSRFAVGVAGISRINDGSAVVGSLLMSGSGTYLTLTTSSGAVILNSGGTNVISAWGTNAMMSSNIALAWCPASLTSLNPDTFLCRKTTAVIQLGLDAAGVVGQMLTAASRITSDGVGANLTIAGGNGRGGAGGTLILATYDTAGAATIGTLRSRMTFDTAGAVAFPVVTAVTAEVVVSDATWPLTINGVAYKVCLKS